MGITQQVFSSESFHNKWSFRSFMKTGSNGSFKSPEKNMFFIKQRFNLTDNLSRDIFNRPREQADRVEIFFSSIYDIVNHERIFFIITPTDVFYTVSSLMDEKIDSWGASYLGSLDISPYKRTHSYEQYYRFS